MKILCCKICEGCPHVKCLLCGAERPKDKDEEEAHREYFRYMQGLWNGLRRAQSISGTGVPELDAEIRAMFGDWIADAIPVYTSRVKELYDDAFYLERVAKHVKRAKVAYMRLYQAMSHRDKIHGRITKDDIASKIAELGRRLPPTPPKKRRK